MAKKRTRAIIFDMDGVLMDTSQSYTIAVKKTAEFFLGKMLNIEEVEEIKNREMNDCDAAELLIQNNGGDFRKQVIIKKFQEYFQGRNFDGLIKKEKCLIDEKTLKNLRKYDLAILTKRTKEEAKFTLEKSKIKKYFKDILTIESIKEQKPSPECLLKIIKNLNVNSNEALYVGSNLLDLSTAKNAGIPFIGVPPSNSDRALLKNILKSEGAEIVLNNINELAKKII